MHSGLQAQKFQPADFMLPHKEPPIKMQSNGGNKNASLTECMSHFLLGDKDQIALEFVYHQDEMAEESNGCHIQIYVVNRLIYSTTASSEYYNDNCHVSVFVTSKG